MPFEIAEDLVTLPDNWQDFHQAVKNKNQTQMDELLAAWGPELTQLVAGWPDQEKNTALHCAAITGDTDIFEKTWAILAADAPIIVGFQNEQGNHVLHLAVRHESLCLALLGKLEVSIISLLVTMINHEGKTVFYMACMALHKKLVDILLALIPLSIGSQVLLTDNDKVLQPLGALRFLRTEDQSAREEIITAILTNYGLTGLILSGEDDCYFTERFGQSVASAMIEDLCAKPHEPISVGAREFLLRYKNQLRKKLEVCSDQSVLEAALDSSTTLGSIVKTCRNVFVEETKTERVVKAQLATVTANGEGVPSTDSNRIESVRLVDSSKTFNQDCNFIQFISESIYARLLAFSFRFNLNPLLNRVLKKSTALQINFMGLSIFWVIVDTILRDYSSNDNFNSFIDNLFELFTPTEMLFLVSYQGHPKSPSVLSMVILYENQIVFQKIMDKIESARSQQIALRMTNIFSGMVKTRNPYFFEEAVKILGRELLMVLLLQGAEGLTVLHEAILAGNEWATKEISQSLKTAQRYWQVAKMPVKNCCNIVFFATAFGNPAVLLQLLSDLFSNEQGKTEALALFQKDKSGNLPINYLISRRMYRIGAVEFRGMVQALLYFAGLDAVIPEEINLEKGNYDLLRKSLRRWVRQLIASWVNLKEPLQVSSNERRVLVKYQNTIVEAMIVYTHDLTARLSEVLDESTVLGSILAEKVKNPWDLGIFEEHYDPRIRFQSALPITVNAYLPEGQELQLMGESLFQQRVITAADQRNLKKLKDLLCHSENLKETAWAAWEDSHRIPLLFIAMELGDFELFSWIKEALSEEAMLGYIQRRKKSGHCILHYAFYPKDPRIPAALMDYYVERDCSSQLNELFSSQIEFTGCTPLHYAARSGKTSIERIHACMGEDFSKAVLIRNQAGETVFNGCVLLRDLEAVRFILQTVEIKNRTELFFNKYDKGCNLLHKLILVAHVPMIELIASYISKTQRDCLKRDCDADGRPPIAYLQDFRVVPEDPDPVELMYAVLVGFGFDQLASVASPDWVSENAAGLEQVACKRAIALLERMIEGHEVTVGYYSERQLLLEHKGAVVQAFIAASHRLTAPEYSREKILELGLDRSNPLGRLFAEHRQDGALFQPEETNTVQLIKAELEKMRESGSRYELQNRPGGF